MIRRSVFHSIAGLVLSVSAAWADEPAPARASIWPDTFVARVEALALLQTLNAELLSHESATLTLEHWCDVHQMASPARIVAEKILGNDKPISPEQRLDLAVTPTEPIRYRRVRLMCGPLVLSEADNWYVPGRLTPEMNRSLDTTDIPFGKVVKGLNYRRHTLSAKLLWSPLPDGWEMNAAPIGVSGTPLVVPSNVLEHRAVLSLPSGMPFSEVVETYTRNVMDFSVPSPSGGGL